MHIAIVGFGPRGLASLEALLNEFSKLNSFKNLEISIFETSENLGTGKAWSLDQPETNYINISNHALQNLKGRALIVIKNFEIPSFPSYTQWCLLNNKQENVNGTVDVYPPRFQMGQYLYERATSICEVLAEKKLLKVYNEKVISVTLEKHLVNVFTKNTKLKVNECLLALGHTTTKDSDETIEFKNHATNTNASYIHKPYETNFVKDSMVNITVAIKGFGLSMIDIVRQLTSLNFGNFKEKENSKFLKFEANNKCVSKIIPYSLNGLPCAPKPNDRQVDELYKPSVNQINWFELQIKNSLSKPENYEDVSFIVNPFSKIVSDIFYNISEEKYSLNTIKTVTEKWMQDKNYKHHLILDNNLPTIDYLKQTALMAWGDILPTLDYTIGQIWRHLQPTLYRLFAYCNISGNVMHQIVALDERTKRYSYGPPLKSVLQLIALNEATILDFNFLEDPQVKLVSDGWELQQKNNKLNSEVMINSILDGPVFKKMNSPIFNSLLQQNLIVEVHKELGVLTNADATIKPTKDYESRIPISVIGRNAKGSVLGADAILECFSPEINNWAVGVSKNL